jgi:hypothetical protein
VGRNDQKSSTKSKAKTGGKTGRGRHQIAWWVRLVRREVERIEAKNRAALWAHFAATGRAEVEANGEFTEPDWQKVVSLDGVTCFLANEPTAAGPARGADDPDLLIPDDLTIPAFLRRGGRCA